MLFIMGGVNSLSPSFGGESKRSGYGVKYGVPEKSFVG